MKRGKAILVAVATVLSMTVRAAFAEPVSVNMGTGLGFVFSHANNCYIVLPEHVHGRKRSLSLRTAAPSAFGEARIFRSFTPGRDLSIGLVTNGLRGRCRKTWDELPDRTDAVLDRTDRASLVRLSASGTEERIPMRITGRDFDTLTARIADGSSEVLFQGTSGGLLEIDGQVIGMAIEASNEREARFLRIDEIKTALGRLIVARGEGRDYVVESEPDPGPSDAPAVPMCRQPDALPVRSVECDVEPLSPDSGCSNLGRTDATAPAIFPLSAPVEIVVELAGPAASTIQRIALSKDEADSRTTAPKAMELFVDSSTRGAPLWRPFGAGDMSPLGTLDIRNGSGPYARRIKIRIRSSWDPALPIRLDCLGVISKTAPASRREGSEPEGRPSHRRR